MQKKKPRKNRTHDPKLNPVEWGYDWDGWPGNESAWLDKRPCDVIGAKSPRRNDDVIGTKRPRDVIGAKSPRRNDDVISHFIGPICFPGVFGIVTWCLLSRVKKPARITYKARTSSPSVPFPFVYHFGKDPFWKSALRSFAYSNSSSFNRSFFNRFWKSETIYP